ncbi:hypothetical protein PAXRUDRAFT_14346 [Paxillus rubicundulus Ve08.2h10]|uniref:Unplaced genomic scaffold scaffold_696, whole genome shotgun sequence n=1 Tax=Paxillus rubicundulus Ve08.2h10 TaxID=930991 RepID=A0A0D0D1V2_9AGAM|nr:hypothetical protein PAXRUDRAFT_14346 [Paxillus rubicundulus Ve08.2h10]
MPKDFTCALHNIGQGESSDVDNSSYADNNNPASDTEELQEVRSVMYNPPPDASTTELHKALGTTQLAYSRVCGELTKLRNKHNALLSILPQTRKKAVEIGSANVLLDSSIVTQAKKYCFLYHFWMPKDIFPLTIPSPDFNLNSPARWHTPELKITGNKAELYFMIPPKLQRHATTYVSFGRVFANAVSSERPNILKPVKDNAAQLFSSLNL